MILPVEYFIMTGVLIGSNIILFFTLALVFQQMISRTTRLQNHVLHMSAYINALHKQLPKSQQDTIITQQPKEFEAILQELENKG